MKVMKTQKYIEITGEKIPEKERDLMMDLFEVRCETSQNHLKDRQLKQLLLSHILYLQVIGITIPDRYMKLGEAWGTDADIWIEKIKDDAGKVKYKRIAFTVTGTSRPAFLFWLITRVLSLRYNNKTIRGLMKSLWTSIPTYRRTTDGTQKIQLSQKNL
jgi:hypothetical protein